MYRKLLKMTFYIRSIISLFLFPSVTSYVQNNVEYDSLLNVYQTHPEDSLKANILDQLYNLVIYQDMDLTRKYTEEQLALSRKINYPKGLGYAYYNLGSYYKNRGIKDTAKVYFEQSEQLFDSIDYFKSSNLHFFHHLRPDFLYAD